MDRFIAEILNRSLTATDGPLFEITGLEFNDPLSRMGRFALTVPVSARALAVAPLLTVLRIYQGDTWLFTGIVEDVDDNVGSNGDTFLTFRGGSIMLELYETAVVPFKLANNGTPLTNILTATLAPASAWSYDTSPTAPYSGWDTLANPPYGQFFGESILQGLTMLSRLSGENFVIGDTDRTLIWIRDNWVASGVRAIQGAPDPIAAEGNANICYIQTLRRSTKGRQVVNRCYPYGSGEGDTRLTIRGSSYAADAFADYTINKTGNYIDYDPAFYPYTMVRERYVQFREIAPLSNTDADVQAAADALADTAMLWLAEHGYAQQYFSLSVLKLVPGRVRPGMTIDVLYEDANISIDSTLNVLDVTWRLIGDQLRADLAVSDATVHAETDASAVSGRLEQGRILTSLPQMGPNVDTIPYAEELDDDYDAELRFWLGDEVAQVQQVLLRFRVDPLRSTIKSTGGSSTSTGSSSVASTGSSTASTTVSDNAPHAHPITIVDVGSAAGNPVHIQDPGSGLNAVGGGEHTTDQANAAHSHGMDHTHGIAHTHDVTAAITTAYGVFEESGGNTYAVTELTYLVNGGAITAGRVSLGGGWYSYDLTEDLIDTDTLRPLANANAVTISSTSALGKSCRISAQLQMRLVIQSIKYA